jgi:phage FluMu protein Com
MKFALSTLALLASAASASANLRGIGAAGNGLQVVIPGALREMSASDAKVFKDALKATYQDAHAVDDVHFDYVEAPAGLEWRCRKCRDDDKTLAEEEGSLYLSVGWRCRKCRDDDDAAIAEVKLASEAPAVHAAWEKAFCAKIAGAGAANFANARDCSIRVSPAGGAPKELQ